MIEVDQLEISGNGLYPAQAPGERPCVLLVEDDPALRRYLEVVLQRAGYDVMSAGDGLEAMKVLLATRVDVFQHDPGIHQRRYAEFRLLQCAAA